MVDQLPPVGAYGLVRRMANLRFVRRRVVTCGDMGHALTELVLQQPVELTDIDADGRASHRIEWEDVPIVDEYDSNGRKN